jgi:hypothetical protein
LHERALILRYS